MARRFGCAVQEGDGCVSGVVGGAGGSKMVGDHCCALQEQEELPS